MKVSVVTSVNYKQNMPWPQAATLTVVIRMVDGAIPIIMAVVEVVVVSSIALKLLLHPLMQLSNINRLLLTTNVVSEAI
jgi:hypothetical protein